MNPSFLSPSFLIGSIHIGTISNASCLSVGNNWLTGFENHSKVNQGFGSVHGDGNQLHGIQALLNDPDFLDMLSLPNQSAPEWLQEIMRMAATSGHQSSPSHVDERRFPHHT